MKVCAIADPHADTSLTTQPADMLVVAGDLTMRGSVEELQRFRNWLDLQPQKYKVVIAGNHDFCLEKNNRFNKDAEKVLQGNNLFYLHDQFVEIEGVKVYGTPWQPWFHSWAFNLHRGPDIKQKWDLIPDGLDILLVHGPPFGYGDQTIRGDRAGCEDLLEAIKKKRPRVTCYGHIHEDVGEWNLDGLKLINCSVGYEIGWHDSGKRGPFYFEV